MKNFKVEAYLSLGSNLGNREEYIIQALRSLSDDSGIEVVKYSGLYESEPLHLRDQPRFLNCVVELKTNLAPEALLEICKNLEKELGRKKGLRFGPRIIDLDILSYNQQVIRRVNLQIPHPRIQDRRFVLEPLCEINPDWEHPVSKKSAGQLLDELGKNQSVKYFDILRAFNSQPIDRKTHPP